MARIFPLVLVLLGAWLGASLPLTDGGYLDLAHGRQVSETGRLTPPDTIVLDNLAGAPSETAGWLGSWLLFVIHRAGGERGLRVFGAVCLAVGAVLLYRVQPTGSGFAAAAAAASLAGSTLDLSTSLFSWPLVALMVFCQSTLRPKNKWWLLLLLLPLGTWPFLNRESMVGFALAVLALCTSLVLGIRRYRRQEGAEKRWLAFHEPLLWGGVLAATAFFVTLIAPEQELAENPIRQARLLKEAGAYGWQAASLGGDATYFLFAIITGLLALATPPFAMPFGSLATASFLLLSLSSRYFVMFFGAVAVPLVCRALTTLGETMTSSSRWSVRALSSRWMGLVLGVVVVLPGASGSSRPHPFADAARYLAEHGLDERLFNLPRAGGVVGWTGGPDRLAFAHLRTRSIEAFQQETTGRRLAAIYRDHDLGLVLVSRDFASQRMKELTELEGHRLLYFDDVALLYAHSEQGRGYPTDLTFDYFDPLLPPSEYAEDTVPLVIQELFVYFDRYPPSAAALWKLGKLLLRVEQREEALEAFEAAHRLDVEDLETLRELSRLYIEKGMYGLAERSARRALDLARDEELVYNLALSLYGQAQFSEAARKFEAVLELNPENLKARRALVDIYRQLGELEQSYLQKQTLDAMVEAKKSALLSLARERHEALDFAGEAALYEEALAVSRDDPELLWDLAMVLLTDERVPEAMHVLRALLEVTPRNADAHLTLGVLCAEEPSCPPDEARIHLEAFLELAPDDINAELAIARLDSLE